MTSLSTKRRTEATMAGASASRLDMEGPRLRGAREARGGQEEGVRAVLDVVHGRELLFAVAAPVARGHEDHPGGADGGHVLRVVPRPGEDAAIAAAEALHGRFHGLHYLEVEARARHAPVVLELVGDALGARGVPDHAVDQVKPSRDVALVGGPQVDGEADPS